MKTGHRHGARAAPPRRRGHRREEGGHAGERGNGPARAYLGAPTPTTTKPEAGSSVGRGHCPANPVGATAGGGGGAESATDNRPTDVNAVISRQYE